MLTIIQQNVEAGDGALKYVLACTVKSGTSLNFAPSRPSLHIKLHLMKITQH
jgi:hypothetical protein